jgi:hypothetical protein
MLSNPKVPITLLLDDTGPINLMAAQDPQPWRVQNIPISFLEKFIKVTQAEGILGKFTLVPYPSCLGRIDQSIPGYPDQDLARFLDLVRSEIMPRWDITPEIITHWHTLDLKTSKFLPVREDHWSYEQNADTLTEYLSYALQLLKNVGIRANGITSPYYFGDQVEAEYARAVQRSISGVCGLQKSWYFLHYSPQYETTAPRIMEYEPETGGGVASIISGTDDNFWNSQYERDAKTAFEVAMVGVEDLLSEDGQSGRMVDLVSRGQPVAILTHQQSLFGEGHAAGLKALEALAQRIKRHLSERVYWTRPSEIASQALAERGNPDRGSHSV